MKESQQIIIDALRAQLAQLDQGFREQEALEAEQRRRLEATQAQLTETSLRLKACRTVLEAYEDSLQA